MSIRWRKCSHEKISTDTKAAYCPDCGEYVENHWYIARCKCCGVKHKTIVKNGNPIPIDNFCKNCGCDDYIVEEIDCPDIVSINYAALKRTSQKVNTKYLVKAWIGNKIQQNYGFLPAY